MHSQTTCMHAQCLHGVNNNIWSGSAQTTPHCSHKHKRVLIRNLTKFNTSVNNTYWSSMFSSVFYMAYCATTFMAAHYKHWIYRVNAWKRSEIECMCSNIITASVSCYGRETERLFREWRRWFVHERLPSEEAERQKSQKRKWTKESEISGEILCVEQRLSSV